MRLLSGKLGVAASGGGGWGVLAPVKLGLQAPPARAVHRPLTLLPESEPKCQIDLKLHSYGLELNSLPTVDFQVAVYRLKDQKKKKTTR
jgi:hypothetical protein